MKTRKKYLNQIELFKIYNQFVQDSFDGSRLQKNGKPLQKGTVVAHYYAKKYLHEFAIQSSFEIKIYIFSKLSNEEKVRAHRYYIKFYRKYTAYLYDKRGFLDNYVGQMIKCLRTFFNYLETELLISVGVFHKQFYSPRHEIPVIALSADQLSYFIYNREFAQKVEEKGLTTIKDIFVFGCTVALRVSDLLSLNQSHLYQKDNSYYLRVKSQKTKTLTAIKLPKYAIEIINKYEANENLLPKITQVWFNLKLKELARLIPDDFELIKIRERRGHPVVIYKDPIRKIHFKLSDHITSHTMRRTAITTMLSLGMPEHLVRKISGHSQNSRDFYKYVQLSQTMLDEATDNVFEKLRKK